MKIQDVIKIIDEKTEKDGSVTITVEAPEDIINFWEQQYGTKDFGNALIRDCLSYIDSHKEELKECNAELSDK